MKRLFILRHAKSSWKDETLDDFDRPLNSRGKNDLIIMNKVFNQYIRQKNIDIEYILSSPSLRTKITIEAMIKNLNIKYDDRLYNADDNQMLSIVQFFSDEYDTALICGHNTAITSFVNNICDADIDNVPTCAFVEIIFECDSWHDIDNNRAKSGILKLFEYPKKYKD